MGSVTWVCFSCRTSSRRESSERAGPRCARCREPKHCIGHKTPLPKKRDVREWQGLRDWYFKERRLFARYLANRRARCIHRLERQLDDLEREPPAKGREAETRRIHEHLEQVRSWSLDNSFGYWHLRRPDLEEHLAARKASWIARLERQLREFESRVGPDRWSRSKQNILDRLEEVRGWSAESTFGFYG